jgi:hypothetical protein
MYAPRDNKGIPPTSLAGLMTDDLTCMGMHNFDGYSKTATACEASTRLTLTALGPLRPGARS